MALFYLSVAVSLAESQHSQYNDSEIKAATWNSSIMNVIVFYMCFPTAVATNLSSVKKYFISPVMTQTAE